MTHSICVHVGHVNRIIVTMNPMRTCSSLLVLCAENRTKFVGKAPINNKLALVWIMACIRTGERQFWTLLNRHIYASLGLDELTVTMRGVGLSLCERARGSNLQRTMPVLESYHVVSALLYTDFYVPTHDSVTKYHRNNKEHNYTSTTGIISIISMQQYLSWKPEDAMTPTLSSLAAP